MTNVAFRQLDSTIMPDMFQSFKCACDNTLEPCKKILEITKVKLEHMKKEYDIGKHNR